MFRGKRARLPIDNLAIFALHCVGHGLPEKGLVILYPVIIRFAPTTLDLLKKVISMNRKLNCDSEYV